MTSSETRRKSSATKLKSTTNTSKQKSSPKLKRTKFSRILNDCFDIKLLPSQLPENGVKILGESKIKSLLVTVIKCANTCTCMIGSNTVYDVACKRKLINKPSATDPDSNDVMYFVRHDSTKLRKYVDRQFVCQDFAEVLHNKVEALGMRCGYVIWKYKKENAHALNVFNTTDKGILFVDTSAMSQHEAVSAFMYDETEFFKRYAPYLKEMIILV